MPFRSRVMPIVLLTLALPPAAAAQQQQTADDKEVYAYVLTMDALQKVMRATTAFYMEAMKDPKYKQVAELEAEIKKLEEKGAKQDDGLSEADQERLDALREKHDRLEDANKGPLDDAQTLSDMEAAIRRAPAFAAALKREGISARDYAKFWIAFWSAGLAHGFQKEGYGSKEMTSLVNPANLKFFAEHEKEIEAILKEHEFVKPKK